jgi:hypothetical protein
MVSSGGGQKFTSRVATGMLVHIKLFLKESILAQRRGEKVGVDRVVSLFGGVGGHCSDIYAQLNVTCNLHDYTLTWRFQPPENILSILVFSCIFRNM